MAKKKSSARPVGIAPLWTEKVGKHYSYLLYLILMDLKEYVKTADQASEPTIAIANIRVLRCLVEAHPPYPRNLRFEKCELAQWREVIMAQAESTKSKIAKRYQEEFLAAIEDDFDFLEAFMDRKRDRKTDLW